MMKELQANYKNLLFAIELFEISWLEDLGVDGNRSSLKRLINEGKINGEHLTMEYEKATNSKTINWRKITVDLNLIRKDDLEYYNNSELLENIGYYLFPFVHKEISEADFKQIEEIINIESKSSKHQNSWISKEYLDKKLSSKLKFYKPYFLLELIHRTEDKYQVKRENLNKGFCIDKVRIKT